MSMFGQPIYGDPDEEEVYKLQIYLSEQEWAKWCKLKKNYKTDSDYELFCSLVDKLLKKS